MLKIIASFIVGALIGYLYHPKEEVPKEPIRILNKIQVPPATICPEVRCETQAVKESLAECLKLVVGLTEQISTLNDEKLDHQKTIKDTQEESAYWKQKYTDFDCGP